MNRARRKVHGPPALPGLRQFTYEARAGMLRGLPHEDDSSSGGGPSARERRDQGEPTSSDYGDYGDSALNAT